MTSWHILIGLKLPLNSWIILNISNCNVVNVTKKINDNLYPLTLPYLGRLSGGTTIVSHDLSNGFMQVVNANEI